MRPILRTAYLRVAISIMLARSIAILLCSTSLIYAQLSAGGATASWRGALPPKPTAALSAEQESMLQKRLDELTTSFATVSKHRHAADAEVLLKAVRFALDFDEWYDKKPEDGMKKATALLDEASKRISDLKNNRTPWLDGSGYKLLGFYSAIDGSAQPYGVEVPPGLDLSKPVPLWIWLHGRGDTATDLHFAFSRLMAKKGGQFQPQNAIVVHPFGRYCNGWKSAGETDVFECRNAASDRFKIDADRIVLAGFSMGGAGAWHIGAHFPSEWACVHTGAGFVDVKRYQKLTPDKMPPWYEQQLWGVYDVPDYARNFFNVPLVCYSGENDSQRDSAEYMTEVLGKEGLKPPHFIGPGMGHKYHPEVIKTVQAEIKKHVANGRPEKPARIVIQSKTLAYSRVGDITITGMSQQWLDARLEADFDYANNEVHITTKNVSSYDIVFRHGKMKVMENGQPVAGYSTVIEGITFWAKGVPGESQPGSVRKRPQLQGPIDDAFKSKFVIVLPDQTTDGSAADKWARAEAEHFIQRWRSLMRGDPVIVKADALTDRLVEDSHLIVWGTPKTNNFLQKLMTTKAMKKVLTWDAESVKIGSASHLAASHVPVLIQPNPMNPNKYVVINSGLTFREAHDRTNSLQNPKLPDWAILDITSPPNSEAAGQVKAADFFDERWQVKAP
jgi:hypothetical protein